LGLPTGSVGLSAFLGVSLAATAEAGIFFGGSPADLGLYTTVGLGGGWGASLGATGSVLRPGFGITDPNAQVGGALLAVGGAAHYYNRAAVGYSVSTGTKPGLGGYGVVTKMFTLSLRDLVGFAYNVMTGVRNGC